MNDRMRLGLCGALSVAALGLLARPETRPDDLPPHVSAGVHIYGLELTRPTDEVLPGIGPATAVKVLGNEGKWYLLETPNQPRGPVWVNFDQVLSYRTQL